MEDMTRLLYLTAWDFQNEKSDGICKKILTQIDTFREAGYQVDFGYTKAGKVYFESDGKELLWGKIPESLKVILAPCVFARKLEGKKYAVVYVRHCIVGPFYIQLLAVLHRICKKVVVEIPSYPYYEELKDDFKLRMAGRLDRILHGQMRKYVNRIVTYSDDKVIFGIPTIQTMNGVDFNRIRKIHPDSTYKSKVNIIAVANLAVWHGFDRLLEGLGKYYDKGGKRDILFHLVGDGNVLESYHQIVDKWKIQKHVIFYGRKMGEELDKIYDYCELSAACFGFHRIGITLSSNLKSREYMAKGLPILTSADIDVFQNVDTPYIFKVPADESPIDVEEILKYCDSLYQNISREKLSEEIRNYSRNLCDISVTMKPVIDYFKLR